MPLPIPLSVAPRPVEFVPPWLAEARALDGLQEVPGAKNNPTILGWAKAVGGWIKNYFINDDIPWCALFVDHCLMSAGRPPAKTLAALDYLKWGQPLTAPTLGAVMVFQRPGGGHVGFYEGERPDAYWIRGGNQSNAVGLTWVAKTRLRGIRWPLGDLVPSLTPILLKPDGRPVSTDEA